MSGTKMPFRVATAIGVLLVFHAGFSTFQYRKHLRMVGEEFEGAPLDVLLEVILGCILALVGVVGTAENFVPIRLNQTFHSKVADDFSFRQDSMTFNHRGRVLGLLLETAGMKQNADSKKRN
ncbi:hypothetical protein T484DRAFT_1939524 [Baffinella frigidus]|nr:hypothetical protein T484DRAFT_1939524 [Cryptophyta sp. CCMP2293]|eukprot:CAMPEP_0180124358 /NCGR_PEP_ID=MMETSP0986-20121125/4607_1 /TAXON_ID=697907 /ORGANISM="non described non described, Strain CCMP2293" /LENGTH=121 /DNA_ID=CAMNT_0022063689 /DNA_START=63 /DNA_END=428 /DNA_ORIENTATION=+